MKKIGVMILWYSMSKEIKNWQRNSWRENRKRK